MMSDLRLPDLPEWLHELYPFQTRAIEVDGVHLSVADEGPRDNAGYVLLHDAPVWSFMFRDLIGRLRQNHRVIAPDLAGFGLSEKPVSASYHTLQRHISNFSAVMDAVALESVTLVLHGWGGPIGLAWAAAHPEKVERLVLINTWGMHVPNANRTRLPLRARVARMAGIGPALDSMLNLTISASLASQTRKRMPDMVAEAYAYPMHGGAKVATQAFAEMFFEPGAATLAAMKQVEEGLSRITAPADIIFAQNDVYLSRLPAYQLRDALKNTREPIFVAGAGHNLAEDAPQAVADVVLRAPKPLDAPDNDSLFKILS